MSGVCYICNFPCNPLSQTCSQCMRNGPPRNSLPTGKNELDTQSKVKKQDGTKGGKGNVNC